MIPEEVRDLLATHVDSLAMLEVLLLLQSSPQRAWVVGEVAAALRIDEVLATMQLVALRQRGFLDVTMGTDASYTYRGSGRWAAAVEKLAECYREGPMEVAKLIASQRSQKLRLFADAFRIRRDE